jgi:putative heme-binding domain-containing protein
MHVAQLFDEAQLLALLDDADPYIQAWAIQLLTEDNHASAKAIQKMISLPANNKSAVVRLYLAAALQKINTADRWTLATELVRYEEDAEDHNIPLMLWFGIESIVAADAEKAMELASRSNIPLIANYIVRRLVDADLLEKVVAALEKKSFQRIDMLNGLLAGIEDRNDVQEPTIWTKVYNNLIKDKTLQPIAQQIAQRFNSTTAAKQLLTVLKYNKSTAAQRIDAIKILARQQRPELIQAIPSLLNNAVLRIEVIRAIAAYNESSLGALLLEKYDSFTIREKQEVLQTMSSRSIYGRYLTEAIKKNQIPKRDIAPYIALQLRRVVGNGFVEIWGPIDDLSNDISAEYAKYQRLLTNETLASADPLAGKQVYQRTCWSCHKMYGDGGEIGPDLTGSNRTNIAYLLSNVLEPSGELQDDYKMVVVNTRDGRTYSGNIVTESERQLTMRIVGQGSIVINKSDIQSKEVTPTSMMPVGLFNTLTEQEILNLVAFLQTTGPIDASDMDY